MKRPPLSDIRPSRTARLRQRLRRSPRPKKVHFSQIIRQIAEDEARERVSVGDLLSAMGDRAFGALMLVFALPNAIPTPPGTSAILGAPLVFLAAQMTVGRKPWLPKLIASRSMARSDFAALVEKLGPWLARAERLMRPRLSTLTTGAAENIIGFICFVLAIVLTLPIPLGNMLPAFAISLFAFAILERDGVWALIGGAFAAFSLTVVAGVLYAFAKALIFLLSGAIN